jgi:hypothetical protein
MAWGQARYFTTTNPWTPVTTSGTFVGTRRNVFSFVVHTKFSTGAFFKNSAAH